jgi:RNA-splicing ligase RtcB
MVDQASIAQVITLCNQEFAQGSRIRLMPDVHAGAGCTVGTTMTITDKVVPNLVGVDIGCGMETARLREDRLELQKLDKLIQERIPSGFAVRSAAHRYAGQIDLEELCCFQHIQMLRAEKSIGTLGGGNHFIEVDRDEEGQLYVVIHSGSRRLGLEVAKYYQEEGYKALNQTDQASLDRLAAEMRAAGRQKEIQKELKRRKSQKLTRIPRPLAYVAGALFDQYIHDMKLVQRFAQLNRQAMLDEIVKGMKLHVEEQFTTIHNYIDTDAMILRKGAVSAKAGERLLIPINMRDGSLICTGLGNEDWNCSAPPRGGPADEPGGGQAVLHRVGVQKADGRRLQHLGGPGHPGRVPHGLQADGGHCGQHRPHRRNSADYPPDLQFQGRRRGLILALRLPVCERNVKPFKSAPNFLKLGVDFLLESGYYLIQI